MGRMAVDAILDLIDGEGLPEQTNKIDTQLIIGESTAKRSG